MIPTIIKDLDEKLNELLEKDDKNYITAQAAADFLGMDVDTLRASAEAGRCPFAISGRSWSKGNRFTKIPKLAFYNWITQGVMYRDWSAK